MRRILTGKPRKPKRPRNRCHSHQHIFGFCSLVSLVSLVSFDPSTSCRKFYSMVSYPNFSFTHLPPKQGEVRSDTALLWARRLYKLSFTSGRGPPGASSPGPAPFFVSKRKKVRGESLLSPPCLLCGIDHRTVGSLPYFFIEVGMGSALWSLTRPKKNQHKYVTRSTSQTKSRPVSGCTGAVRRKQTQTG